jgi:hypothetical protein
MNRVLPSRFPLPMACVYLQDHLHRHHRDWFVGVVVTGHALHVHCSDQRLACEWLRSGLPDWMGWPVVIVPARNNPS